MASNPLVQLGEFLTAAEARGMAAMLASGQSTNKALNEVTSSRRTEVKTLMAAAELSHHNPELAVAVLQGITGAKAKRQELTPVWTMPGNEAEVGRLTNQFHSLVEGARISVTAASYNFTANSRMWTALKKASEQPGVQVAVYVDGDKGDGDQVKAQMPKALVYESGRLPNGSEVVSHAKFVIIDHALMLLTSANFSYNAENKNIEFGLLINDPGLCESVEDVMAEKRGSLYVEVQ